ncbi:MAG: hypothetical protein WA510_18610 [Acidobacteriaceae bacterium]
MNRRFPLRISAALLCALTACAAHASPPACLNASESSLPLPSTVPPSEFVSFEMQVLDFLQSQQYLQLSWCTDKEIRNTGPFKDGVSYGTHPAVKVYYSPKYIRWLAGGREGSPPDGAMVIKSQLPPPAERYSSSSPTPQDWTVMIRDSRSTKDGWFWGEWYVGMTFDNDQYPFNYPTAGYALYCLRCHSSAQSEYTFASLSNIEGFPGKPLTYPVDDSWQSLLGSGYHGPSPPSEATLLASGPASQEFLKTYTAISDVPAAKVQDLPSETYDRVFSSAHGPGQFLTSDQCMSCHSGLNGPFGPIMFLSTGPYTNGAYPGYNISPYGEWRWSPMGLAGRDPIFYAQMDSELTFAKTQPANPSQLIVNTCVSCHGVMGDRQIDIDQPTNQNFNLDYVTLIDRSSPHFKYGALARDGVSCQACHHMVQDDYPSGEAPLKYFLENSITGRFQVGPADKEYGPFKSDTVVTWPMKNGLGITPGHNAYLKSARLCGSCHTIQLPVIDSPVPDTFSIEQATYLEWLNSKYQNEFGSGDAGARTCQSCHMPSGIHNQDVNIDQLQEKIATIEDSTYPITTGRVPDSEIRVTQRDTGYVRHTFQGLNAFLLELFEQFNNILGVRTSDYMTTSVNDLPNAVAGYSQQAQSQTATIDVSATSFANTIDAQVKVTNLTGHRLPTGVGFRRAFIQLLVTEDVGGEDKIVWSSGRTNDLGIILDGNGNVLPSEFFTTVGGRQAYQPHYQTIDSQDEVQIYEELVQDSQGQFTTSFVRRDKILKDNRLLPQGWTGTGPDPSLSGVFLDATYPKGRASLDPDYRDGSGTDRVAYHIKLPSGIDPANCKVAATLYYQSTPPAFLEMRFQGDPSGLATQRLYYLESHLNVGGTVIDGWKIELVSASAAVE